MILLITAAARAQACSEALSQAMAQPTDVAGNIGEAARRLRSKEYSVVVMDQLLLEVEPDGGETLLKHLDTAIPVWVNFAISSSDRVVREVRAAVSRRKCELSLARRAAAEEIDSEVKGDLTALLLSCKLAIDAANVPAVAVEKMQTAYQLAQKMSDHLARRG